MPMDNVTLENTQQSISSRDAKSVASVMVNGKWVNLSDTLEQANVKSDVGTVSKQVAEQQTVITSAVAQADSAVAYANDAIEKSRVNSQAIVEINSAVTEAKQGANDAMIRAKSAWDAAQSNVDLIDSSYASASAAISSVRNEAIAAANEAKTSASAAQADIVAVRSDVAVVQAGVATNKSDVAVAKSDIAITKTDLASQANSLSSYAAQASAAYDSTASALSDAKTELSSDVVVAKNLANTAQVTADNAIKSASSVADDLTKAASQAKANADGITKVTSDVGLLQTTVANNTGDISTIQKTAKQIQQSVSDNAGNITVAKQTADSAVAVASDARSNATVAVQTASQASITANNASGQAASAVLTAQGAITTANNANSNATVAVQTASGASLTATNANSDATVAKQTASEAKVQASNAESDFAQLSIRANKIEANVADNSGAIASVQQTANGLTTTVGKVDDRVKKIEDTTNWTTKTGPLDMNTLTTTQNIYYRDTNLKNADGEAGWAYIQVVSVGERVTQTVWHDRSSIQHTRTGAASGSSYNWDAWNKVATNAQVVQVKQTVDRITTTINDPKTGLNATYQTAAGNATTISNIKGDVSQLKVSASSASVALSDAAGNISSLKAMASELETKYADAANDISQIKTDAKGMTQTISNAQGDIANLKTRADGFDTQFATANGNISKLQTDATGTKQTLTNAKSAIAVLQSRADGLDAKYANAAGDINTLKANASGFSQTLTNAQGDISTLKSTVTGVQNTLTDAQGNISTLQSDVSGLKKTTSDNAGNISALQSTANTLTSQMSSAQGDISTLKQTSSGISSQVSSLSDSAMQNRGTVDSPDFNSLTQAGYYTITSPSNGKNYPTGSWGTLEVSGQVTDINGRLNQKYVSDNNGTAYTRQYNANTKGWTAWVKVANQNDIDTLNGKITANTTAIDQNKQAIALKADQTAVDKINGTVSQLQSSLTVQAGQIQEKVTSSQVTGMLTGYATQEYTQTQIKQTSDSWNANLTSVKNGLTQSYTNLHATVDGIQAEVYNKDGSSKITQLSNLIATKVSQGDYKSQITQLKNDINLRVKSADLISQINLQAGTALIQSNKLVLDAGTTVVTGNAFIPVAAIADLTADQVQAGTLKGVKVDFRDSTGTGMIADGSTLTFDVSNTPAGYLTYNGMPIAELPDGSGGNELAIRYRLSTSIIPDDNSGAQATFSKAAQKIAYMTGTNQGKQMLSGLEVHSNNHHWLCAVNSDATCNRFEVNDRDGLNIAWHDNTHLWISDGKAKLYKDNNDSQTATELEVHGWAWVNGWVEAAGHSTHSALSTKTDIQPVDNDKMLKMVNDTDLTTYLYKTDVASGETHRHIGLIIDDVHDVAQYQAPQDFIAPNGVSRDDDNMIGALFGAVKALTKRIKILESKIS